MAEVVDNETSVAYFESQLTQHNNQLSEVNERQHSLLDEWKEAKVNIAFIGQSRQGKSSLINALMGEKIAKVGAIKSTTKSIQKLQHPKNSNCVLWDLPGIDGQVFRRENYFEKLNCKENDYDLFVLVTKDIFGDSEVFIAETLQKMGKVFYMVRTHVDETVRKTKDNEDGTDDNDAVHELRAYLKEQLEDKKFEQGFHKVYLVNTLNPVRTAEQFDMPGLLGDICDKGFATNTKTTAFLFTIRINGEKTVHALYKQLKKRIQIVAAGSAAGGAQPIPFGGVLIDASIIYNEIKLYLEKFQLTKTDIAKFEGMGNKEEGAIEARVAKELQGKNPVLTMIREHEFRMLSKEDVGLKISKSILTSMLNSLFLIALSEAVENVIKVGVPLAGAFVAAGISYLSMRYQLGVILKEVRDVALLTQNLLTDESLDRDPDPSLDQEYL